MKRARLMVVAMIITINTLVASEGMWLPILIGNNLNEMQQMGLGLSESNIYHDSLPSLKDAIVRFGRGCTGSFISAEGLLLTNHHCAYGQIQAHSTVDNDYLQHGFWAGSREEELQNHGLTITLLKKMKDVTGRVLEATHAEMNEEERNAAVRRISEEITKEVSSDQSIVAQVVPFYYGNEYFLFIYQIYRDVRLVGVPPSYIGKYGGDTDNWTWPRHSGDFALFRVYAGDDNQPADYDAGNVPFKPGHYLPISNDTPEENDFTMVIGYPGSTNQYLTSQAVEFIKQVEYPMQIGLRRRVLDIYEDEMKKSDAVRIQYASKHARISNAWKRWQGEIRGLRNLDALAIKKSQEETFFAWTNMRQGQDYFELLNSFYKLYNVYQPYRQASQLYAESIRHVELFGFARQFEQLVKLSTDQSKTDSEIAKAAEEMLEKGNQHFRNYHVPIDTRIAEVMLENYISMSPAEGIGAIPDVLRNRRMHDIGSFTQRMYRRSMLASEDETVQLLKSYKRSDYKKIQRDPAFQLAVQLETHHQEMISNTLTPSRQQLDSLYRLYTTGLRQMQPYRKFFPDANGTMRISYGKVEGSLPRNGMSYQAHTTAAGILEKANETGIDDYQISERFSDLLKNKDYGSYVHNNELVVNFVSSNHTTGGNSGSPVINGKGQLVGLNFDRSWESTMSDIMFDPGQCRNISVNMQYILWVIDHYAGQGYLIREMDIYR